MQKWNIAADRARRADEKYRIIFLVIMFTPGVRLIKMSKKWLILCSFAGESKALITVEAKYLKSAPMSFLSSFRKW